MIAHATAYSHRDRRAHRTVWRALGLVTGASGGLVALALVAPGALAPAGAIAGLVGVGAVYLGWGDRILMEYTRDLRSVRDETREFGFLRAEVRSEVGLTREVGKPTGRSPHSRPRTGERRSAGDGPPAQP